VFGTQVFLVGEDEAREVLAEVEMGGEVESLEHIAEASEILTDSATVRTAGGDETSGVSEAAGFCQMLAIEKLAWFRSKDEI